MRRRKFLQVAFPAIVSLRSTLVWSQLNEQPIRMILPFAPGGSGDALARIMAEQMRVALGRTVLVENRTGGSGRIGVVAVKNAAADGSTLLITPIAPMAVYQHTYKSLGYDPIKDFAPVSQLAIFDFGLAVRSDLPVSSLKEFVAWVKGDPARTAFGTPSTGDLTHFLGILFGRAANLNLRHVPYRGAAAATTDLLAGHIPSAFVPVSDLAEMHASGRVRILATSGKARSPFTPDIPTFHEAGYDVEGSSWYGIFAPAKTSAPTVESFSNILAATVRLPEVSARLHTLGLAPTGTSPAELAAVQRADSERWAIAVKLSGFTAED
jgi:tripartite-type tricarboxylate transporter receptor subunit TctC